MYEYKAECIRVVDGDTVDLLVDLGFGIKIAQRYRLARVDTPERGEDGFQSAKSRVMEVCLDKTLVVESKGKDKYGRWLGEIFTPSGHNVSDLLINEGLGAVYS